jgi:hypothetical protein
METIVVEIAVPACNGTFDFVVPASTSVSAVVREMVRILEETGQNVSFVREKTQLCDMDQFLILENSMSLVEQSVRDGSRLMLI